MKESPRNKMIETKDEQIKTASPSPVARKKPTEWYFPHLKMTVAAETYEEALHIINNLRK